MSSPALDLPKTFVLYNREDHFVEMHENETEIDFIEDIEGKKYIGIRISGLEAGTSNAFIIDIYQETDDSGEHLHEVFENNTEMELTEYQLTRNTLLQTKITNLETIFCSSFLFNDI